MLEIRLLGQFDVRRDGFPVEIASRPSRLLFAYLALSAGKHHPRERLAGLLWPDSDQTSARGNLRQALWRLRKSIGEEILLVDNETVAFNTAAAYWLDTESVTGETGGELVDIVALYEGELLPGYYEDWVLLERERLRNAFEANLQRLIDSLEQQQKWSQLIHWAEFWIASGQTPEPAYRALMVAHAAQGDKAAVVVAYQRCLTALDQEVGVGPSAATLELYAHLLQGKGTAERPSNEDDHAIFGPRDNLPQQGTALIGREREMAQIRERLEGARLLTLVGAGGTGKTRLALQAASEMISAFRNGVFLVSLASVEAPHLIAQKIAETISFPLSSDEDPKAQLLRHLRHRQYFFVLDNFEHLLPGASLVGEILQNAGQVQILATSREKLNLQEEMIYRIDGLAYPTTELATDARDFSAIQLFIESARLLRPGIGDDDSQLPHIVRICRLLEGMPLAILLAAAWVEAFTLEEIAAEITQSLDFLQATWRDMPGRHHSVRAAFDPSWQQLTEEQRARFAALSVFKGGFTKEAAAAVAGAQPRELAILVNKSLLRRDLDTGRYTMHELLRQYAGEHLSQMAEAGEVVARAHAVYYSVLMDQQWLRLIGDDNLAAMVIIDADLENLRHSWRHWLKQGDGRRIRMYFYPFWRVYELRSWSNTGMALFSEAAAALEPTLVSADEETEVAYAELLAGQAHFMANLGYTNDGRRLAQESVTILRRLRRFYELGMPLITLRYNTTYVEDSQKVFAIGLNEAKYRTDHDGQWKKAYVGTFTGRALGWAGDHDRAKKMVSESRRLFESLGDRLSTTWSWLELGHFAVRAGDYDEAQQNFQRVRQIAETFKYRWALVKANRYLGNIAFILDDQPAARKYLLQSLRLADDLGMIRDVISALYDMALLLAREGKDRDPGYKETAVRLLVLVRQHPLSNQTRTLSLFTRQTNVRYQELAERHLLQLREELSPDIYAAAEVDGRDLALETAVSMLLAARQTH